MKGEFFNMIAFGSYGFFWVSFALTLLIENAGTGPETTSRGMAWYMFMWSLFSLCMFVATLKDAPLTMSFLFFTVVLLFDLLAAAFWSHKPKVS